MTLRTFTSNIVKVLGLVALLQLGACSTFGLPAARDREAAPVVTEALPGSTPWSRACMGPSNASAWRHLMLPSKKATNFVYAHEDGREAMTATAVGSVSMWRQSMHVEPASLGKLKFSWKVPALIERADMALRESDDSAVRVVLAFDGDRSKFSAKNAMLSELARVLTGEELPYATLMYVWCNSCDVGSVIVNPRTDRIRKLVLESGPERLNKWVDYERVIRADFEKAFGEAPGALLSVSLMTDSDNTQSSTKAWYGPLALVALPQ